jgi:hypothetical protein
MKMLRFNFARKKEGAGRKLLNPDLVFALIVFLSFFGGAIYLKSSLSSQLLKVKKELSALHREIKRLEELQKGETELRRVKRELERKLRVVSLLSERRQVPKPLYFFAKRENVKSIWLDSLFIGDEEIRVDGNTLNFSALAPFVKKLEESFGKVKLNSVHKEKYEGNSGGFELEFYKFSVEVKRGDGLSD